MFKIFSKAILVRKVEAGKQLNQAKARSVQEFVTYWLQNRPRKALVGNWLVLYENDSEVYWGKPRFRSLFSDAREVEELFKTPKKELMALLPAYQKTINSLPIKRKLEESIDAHYEQLDGVHIQSHQLLPGQELEFKDDWLLIHKTVNVKYISAPHQPQPKTRQNERKDRFTIQIDPSTGKLKKIKTPH